VTALCWLTGPARSRQVVLSALLGRRDLNLNHKAATRIGIRNAAPSVAQQLRVARARLCILVKSAHAHR
jgi:hypothetical protein